MWVSREPTTEDGCMAFYVDWAPARLGAFITLTQFAHAPPGWRGGREEGEEEGPGAQLTAAGRDVVGPGPREQG